MSRPEPSKAPVEELMQLSTQHMLSQFPVYEGDIDHIIGLVHVRDLVRPEMQRPRTAAKRVTSVRGLMREILFVPASIRLDVLLQEFRAKHQHFAIALDEYGGTAGLVTLADVMAKIVGEVRDAFDRSAPQVQRLPDGSTLVDGLMQIDEVNEHFGLQLRDDNYDTIAGFVLGQLGRMAAIGDAVEADGVKLRVEALDGKRIARLLRPQKSRDLSYAACLPKSSSTFLA